MRCDWSQKYQFYSGIKRKIMILSRFNSNMKIHGFAFSIHYMHTYVREHNSNSKQFFFPSPFSSLFASIVNHELCNHVKYNLRIWMCFMTMQVFNFIYFPGDMFYSIKCHVIHRLRLCMRKYAGYFAYRAHEIEWDESYCVQVGLFQSNVIRCFELCWPTTRIHAASRLAIEIDPEVCWGMHIRNIKSRTILQTILK